MARSVLLLFIIMCVLFYGSSARTETEPERDYEIAMTKGLAELQAENAAGAVAFFRQARSAKPKDRNAALSLGIAYAKAGDLPDAKASLKDAQSLDPADPRTNYELAVVLDKMGDSDAARERFEAAASSPLADEALRNAARAYLLKGAAAPPAGGFKVSALLGFQYDSNVILEPALAAPVAKEKKSDWAAVASLEGMYRFLLSQATALDAGYQLYQSLHGKLEDYNIQQHTLKASVRHQTSSSTAISGKYAFSYTLVGGSEHYSTINEISPSVETKFTPGSTTQFRYTFQDLAYYDDPSFPLNKERSGANHGAGITHSVQWDQAYQLMVTYDYTKGSADKEYWSFVEHYGQIALQAGSGPWSASLSASYRDTRYDEVMTGLYAEARHDGSQEYAFTLARKFSERIMLSLSDSHIINDSNLAPFEYTRNIAGLFIGMRL